jgi:hypothetical protein
MLEFGSELEALDFGSLTVNADTASLREQLGRRIGIDENLHEPKFGSLRRPVEANIGHAAFLCLQGQGEIANPDLLFHRQGERGIDQTLRDTIPYFLGAVPSDQALKRVQLREARRVVQRLETALRAAQAAAQNIEADLLALLLEAQAVGLIGTTTEVTDRTELVQLLESARRANTINSTESAESDHSQQDRRRELGRERDRLRDELRSLASDRALLLDERDVEGGYVAAVEKQLGRLTSLNLLGGQSERAAGAATRGTTDGARGDQESGHQADCPLCGSELAEADPAVNQLEASIRELSEQLQDVQAARPARRGASTRIDERSAAAREQLRAVEGALQALSGGDATISDVSSPGRQDFTRGRIDATLGRMQSSDNTELRRLQAAVASASRTVEQLEAELDEQNERQQLTSRLNIISRDMTNFAGRLNLEHQGGTVRLDLADLTVVADTETGPAPLFRIGSADNWIGYHLVTHLALHRYFVRQDRPVPRLLMLDQPTQAYYPSEISQRTGIAENDADRVAVNRMFRLFFDIVSELAPSFQLIVCDHANLPDKWFQDSIVHNWRNGVKLIPADWLA